MFWLCIIFASTSNIIVKTPSFFHEIKEQNSDVEISMYPKLY